MQGMRPAVVERFAALDFEHDVERELRDEYARGLLDGVELPLRPQHPDVALYYLEEDDASMWGSWFGSNIGPWLDRFGTAPETLEDWCQRVLWRDQPQKA